MSLLPLNQIINGDAFEVLDTLPNNSIDVIVIDPPYSRFHHSDCDASLGDFKILEVYFRELAQKCKRVLKVTGHSFFFCDYRTYPCLFYGLYTFLKPANLIIWRKDFIGPGIRFRPLHELIVYCPMMDAESPKDRNIGDIWEAPRVNDRIHPFQKPEDLYKVMIKNCSDVDGVILDPYCGSGSCLVAAKTLGRNWIGVEIDPKYAKIAEDRIQSTPTIISEKLELFDKKSQTISIHQSTLASFEVINKPHIGAR
jgi:site-specific DNA-methyltransferase (adenine-specific)